LTFVLLGLNIALFYVHLRFDSCDLSLTNMLC